MVSFFAKDTKFVQDNLQFFKWLMSYFSGWINSEQLLKIPSG